MLKKKKENYLHKQNPIVCFAIRPTHNLLGKLNLLLAFFSKPRFWTKSFQLGIFRFYSFLLKIRLYQIVFYITVSRMPKCLTVCCDWRAGLDSESFKTVHL